MVDDIGNISIAEHLGEWRHGTRVNHATDLLALQSFEHHVYLLRCVVFIDGAIAFERWKRTGQAFATCLVTGGTVRCE